MTKFLRFAFFAIILALTTVSGSGVAQAADYNNNHLMDDQIFDNYNTMSEAQIQSFLASKGPCLANYNDVEPFPNWDAQGNAHWTYSGSVPASKIIYKSSQIWGINPQVIIATLQKEESLITGTSCDGWRYNSAMGYGCPDSGGCNAKYAGFTRQVLWGAWQLKFNKERSLGNTAWDGDGSITYVGYMTQGYRKRCDSCANVYYDGNATIDGQQVYLETGTTASLYTYTPHLGQSFPGIFESWFGSVRVASYSWNVVDQRVKQYSTGTDIDISNGVTAGDRLIFYVRAQNTGTATWTNTGTSPVRLGTSHPNERSSVFCEVSWIACHRPVQMLESSVAPGEIGTFQFAVQAPATPGTYNEYFNLLAEGTTWMNDIGLFFTVKVNQPNLQYTVTSDTLPTQLAAGATGSGTITLRNDSNFTWYNAPKFPTRLGSSGPPDRYSAFYDASTWVGRTRLANQTEFRVPPGQSATFTATLRAPDTPGTYTEALAPVADGIQWAGQSFNHTVTVKQDYDATLDGASTSAVSLAGADTTTVTFKYLNTGLQTWTNSGANPIRLGTDSPSDRVSGFCAPGWIACHRPVQLQESSVAPGQIGTFQFQLEGRPFHSTNPYFERFRPLKEGVKWFGQTGSIKINYTHQEYGWQLTDQYAVTSDRTPYNMATMSPGQTITIGFKAKNTGSATWYNGGHTPVRVATSRPTDRASSFCTAAWIACHRPSGLIESSVAPGQIGTFEFEFKAPATKGTYSEYFIPVIEGYRYLPDIGLYYVTKVQ